MVTSSCHLIWSFRESTNLGLGTLDAAALIVRVVRGWANDMAVRQDADVVLQIDLENAYGRAFRSTCMEAARTACPQRAAICATALWEDTRFWQRCDDGWTVDSTTRGGWQESRAMQVMFVLGLPSPSLTSWLRARSRGSACRMTCSTWCTIGGVLAEEQVTDSVATNVEYGRKDLSSLRTQNCR